MKLLVLLVLAGCAVNCDESGNYYVIERPSDEPVREAKPFQVYWNVPTFQCKSKKITFENLFERYGIIQNRNDSFQGEQITILYDPGLFPAILKEENSGKLRTRNGGVPQEGNLDEHLTAFRYVLDQSIPDPQFSGIGIIDFESWRPIFRQNFWGVLTPYRNLSLLIERRLHPWWTKSMIEKEAKFRFERAGREFMQATVALARLLRPQAKWGYYGFPYCFNMAGAKPAEACSSNIQKENDQISWLWRESTALYPSVYSSQSLSAAQLAALVRGRVAESRRVGRGAPVLPYFWFKYRDAGFMSEVGLKTALKAMYKSHTSGLILWGSSNDVNTVSKCEKLKNYLGIVLGPEIAKYTKQVYKIDESYVNNNDTNSYNMTTQNPFASMTSDSRDDENIQTVDLDSEKTNENNSENIQSRLDDEMMSNANESDKITSEKNILIDIVLSLIENVQKYQNEEAMETTMKKINKDRKKGTPIHDTFTSIFENDSNFTTESPLSGFKKKGGIFAFQYPNQNTTKSNEIITITDGTTKTIYNLESTTVEMLYDTEPIPIADYNQNTFLDEEFNYAALSEHTTENSNTLDTVSSKENKTTVTIFYEYEVTEPINKNTTEEYYDDKANTDASLAAENKSKIDAHGTNIMESTTTASFGTTDRTTTVDNGEIYDTGALNDDSEYQVVIY